MSSSPSVGLFFLLGIGLLAFGLGAFLFKRGIWPRRLGTDPYCGSCGYSLIALDSTRCPECGQIIGEFNIVRGQRHRRIGVGLTGIMFALLSLGLLAPLLAGTFSSINWYQYKPTFFVMRDLRSASANAADLALKELNRREQAGHLSSTYEQQIIEMGLAQQATTPQSTLTSDLIEFAERQYLAGHLSQAQKTQFGQQCMILSLHIRPTVVAGDWVPFEIVETCRVTGSPLWVSIADANKVEIDGVVVREGDNGGGSMSGLGAGGAAGGSIKSPPPGKHQLAVSSRIELYHGPWDSTDPKDVL